MDAKLNMVDSEMPVENQQVLVDLNGIKCIEALWDGINKSDSFGKCIWQYHRECCQSRKGRIKKQKTVIGLYGNLGNRW